MDTRRIVDAHALAHGHHRGGRTRHRHQPVKEESRSAQLLEKRAHPLPRPLASTFEFAVGGRIGSEKLLGDAAAPDVERARPNRIAARATGHDFCGAAADVHDEQTFAQKVARRARERQRRLARAGDHRKLDAALGKQALELARVACVARRRRGDSRHLNGTPRPFEAGKHLLVARDGVQHAAHGLGPEHARGVHAFAEVRDGVLAIKLAQKPLLVDVGNEHTAGHCADVDGGIATGTDSAPSGPLRHVGQHGPRRALRHVPHASLLYSTPNSGSRRVEYHVSGASMLSETMLARNVDPSSGRSRPRTLAVSSPSFTQPNCS